MSVTFVTGNDEKFAIAAASASAHGFTLEHASLDIDEIQGENSETIALDKAEKAFQILQKPIVINDDSWEIPGLNGFPGPYMKSVSQWFTPQDFINLTRGLEDKRAMLVQFIVYQDESGPHIIRNEFENRLLPEARGSYGNSWQKVVAVPSDNGLSVAEVYDKGVKVRDREVSAGWDRFAQWYAEHHT